MFELYYVVSSICIRDKNRFVRHAIYVLIFHYSKGNLSIMTDMKPPLKGDYKG